ncbi:MAG: 30S ribosomal protein S27e [Halobacteria archaeon]
MTSRILKVKCGDCENEQNVFERASSPIACAVCGSPLVKTTGGKGEMVGQVREVVEER